MFKKLTAAVVALSLVVGLGAANTQNTLNVNTACAASTESDSKEVKVDNITYTVYADHAEVKEAIKSISGEVIIPNMIEGVPVTAVGDHAFDNCSFNSVKFPSTVKKFGVGVFL